MPARIAMEDFFFGTDSVFIARVMGIPLVCEAKNRDGYPYPSRLFA